MVIGAFQDWLITTIVQKAITKIVSMFNPAGAIVQAILAIVSIVQFVVEKAAQIMEFVESVINSIHAIATGSIGAAVKRIETALANAVPILIGFLASLLGLSGVSAKIREFITKVQTKVDAAIDKAIAKVVAFVKKTIGKLLGKDKKDEKKKEAEDPERSKKAKKRAGELLRGRTRTPLAGLEDLKGIVSSVLNQLRPEGLKSLRIVEKTPGVYTIKASASAEEDVDDAEVEDPDQHKKELPPGKGRTPEQNKKARNYFKGIKKKAREKWAAANGGEWPKNPNGSNYRAEHSRALKDGGDPWKVIPLPGEDGEDSNKEHMSGDQQRWGAQGTPAREKKKKEREEAERKKKEEEEKKKQGG
jgi:hypothetical protein